MAAGSGAIPHPAVSFYTCPTSILTLSFQINVLSYTKWVFRGVLFRENVLGGTKVLRERLIPVFFGCSLVYSLTTA